MNWTAKLAIFFNVGLPLYPVIVTYKTRQGPIPIGKEPCQYVMDKFEDYFFSILSASRIARIETGTTSAIMTTSTGMLAITGSILAA